MIKNSKVIEIFTDPHPNRDGEIREENIPFLRTSNLNPSDFRVLLVYPNLPLMMVPPLAMAIFTNILKNLGYAVQLFETTAYIDNDESQTTDNRVETGQYRSFDYKEDLGIVIKRSNMFEDFRSLVVNYKPHLMIFSVVEDSFIQGVKLLNVVSDFDIPHIFGGVFPTAAPERAIQQDEIKMIGVGEGENVIKDYAEALRLGNRIDNIKGTWLKLNNGQIIKNKRTELVNLTNVNPDFSLFDSRRFYRPMGGKIFRMVPIETYRGCPYLCTFCNSPMQVEMSKEEGIGDFLRRKSIFQVRGEIQALIQKYDPEFLYFVDDSFLARPKKEIFEFCDMYDEFKIPFWFNTRPENCRLPEMRRLKEVGAYRISFGIECGNEQYRKNVLLRSQSNKQAISYFKIIEQSEIPFSINLIIGFPGETRELIMDTVELVRSISGYDALTVSIFTPYHGTKLREIAVQNGWLNADTITKHTTSSSLLKMPSPYISSKEIDGLMRTLPLYCYFPKNMWKDIKKAESFTDDGNIIFEKLRDIYRTEFLGENQEVKLNARLNGATGCRTNEKDAFIFSPNRMTDRELQILSSGY
jgi:anaerobic magnesium-protoporphyrin IX monomethyl ester cyclase